MSKVSEIICDECKLVIPRAKRITVTKNTWNEKQGDYETKVEICYNCYIRNYRRKQLQLDKMLMFSSIILGALTFYFNKELADVGLDPTYAGVPTDPNIYIITGLIFFVLAVFFYLVYRRHLRQIEQMRIIYSLE